MDNKYGHLPCLLIWKQIVIFALEVEYNGS